MRILIVGGGIAGLTLAGLLYRRGVEPVVVEKRENYDDAGYFLSLWPLGSRVLWGLGLYEQYRALGTYMPHYHIRDFSGRLIRRYALGELFREYGDLLLVTRAQLLAVLRSSLSGLPLRMGQEVTAIAEHAAGVEVSFGDGRQESFDLVVGADGLHSQVRRLVFGEIPLTHTGWGGWMWWADGLEGEWPATEYWGARRYAGFARVGARVGAVVGMPIEPDFRRDKVDPAVEISRRLGDELPPALEQLAATAKTASTVTFLRLSDVKMPRWHRGRVVLVGDAGAGFLPTAGVGASMAMESAAVLNDELQRVDSPRIPHALALYEQRRRKRIDAIQAESRQLARLMFTQSEWLAMGSRLLLRYYARPQQLLQQISRQMHQPI